MAADEATAADLTEMDLAQLMQIEVETVTVASKFAQKITAAPASISVVTSEEIRRFGYRTLAEVLRSVAGFYVSYDRNYQFLGVRGFSRPGDFNTRILVMINGQRLNDAVYDQGAIGSEMPVDVDLIERVEVIRGPSSSIYGSNALLGVVNIITKTGREINGLEAAGAVGSHDAAKARLAYGRGLSAGGRFLLSGTWDENDGDEQLRYQNYEDPAESWVAEDLDGDRARRLFAIGSWSGLTLQGIYSRREKDVPTAVYEMLPNDQRAETADEFRLVDLKYDHAYADGLQLMARASYNDYQYDGDYPYLDETTEESYLNRDETESRTWVGELQVAKPLFGRHLLTVGGEVRHSDHQDQLNYDVGSDEPLFDDTQSSTIWALYLQDEIRLLEKLTLSAGLRYDHYETFGSTTNPRLALIYQPTEQTSLKLLYGEAFRAPNAYELYYQDTYSIKANPDLDPETITSWEVVFEHYLGSHLRYSLAAFHYQIDDLISQEPDPVDPDNFSHFANLESVTSYGVECEVERKWQGGLQARASYTYAQAEDDDTGKWLVNSPKHLAKLNLRTPLLDERLQAGVEVLYTSDRKTLQGTEAGDFFLTNLTLFSHGLLPGLDLSASVYNLFDKTYDDPASLDHLQDVIGQDGRTFRVSATYRY